MITLSLSPCSPSPLEDFKENADLLSKWSSLAHSDSSGTPEKWCENLVCPGVLPAFPWPDEPGVVPLQGSTVVAARLASWMQLQTVKATGSSTLKAVLRPVSNLLLMSCPKS